MKSLRTGPSKINGSPSNPPAENDNAASKTSSTFHQILSDPDIVERVHVTIKDAHVFKLPTRHSVSIGYKGADWKEKMWQGNIKVVERGDHCLVLLVDKVNGNIFAVCPVKDGAIERCVDSSRYFVLRIESAQGRHMFIGLAFNFRNDAFDFNTALQDMKRGKEAELNPGSPFSGPSIDYRLKEGEKIHVNIPKVNLSVNDSNPSNTKQTSSSLSQNQNSTDRKKSSSSGFLAPSSKDTPSRALPTKNRNRKSKTGLSPQNPTTLYDAFSKVTMNPFH